MKVAEADFGQQAWNDIVWRLPHLSLMQTWEYAEAKAATGPWKPVRAVIADDGVIAAAFQGLFRPLPVGGGGLLWINRGPLVTADAVTLSEVLPAIEEWARSRNWYVRIAPPVADGTLDAPILKASGFRRSDVGGWCSSCVDLTLATDDLLKSLDRRWRNHLNKSNRNGVVVKCATDEQSFEQHMVAYATMLREKGFRTSLTPEFLRHLRMFLPADRRPIVYTATYNSLYAGSDVIVVYGDTAEYYSGTMTREGRAANAGNALLWTAITDAHGRGFRRMDLGGMHPVRTPKGIYEFKEGVRGTPYCLENEIETSRRDWRSTLIRWRVSADRRKVTP
jgi:lipid II:glycine glycyltransferase (peptidoglycan interpeptide bridge formation enzyme)